MLYRLKGKMFDKYIYNGLHFIMKYAGMLNSWAWRKHVKILRNKQNIEREQLLRSQENAQYLEELKRKL
jgi:hypothetical protein